MKFFKGVLVAGWILICLGAVFYIGRVNGEARHECPKQKYDFKKVPVAFAAKVEK